MTTAMQIGETARDRTDFCRYFKTGAAVFLHDDRIVAHSTYRNTLRAACMLARTNCTNIRPEPAFGRLAGMSQDGVAALCDEPTFVVFPESILALGTGAPVADELVAAGQKRRRDLRTRIQRRRVHIVRAGQVEFVQQIEQVP